jgi:raffinose synthase
MVVQVSGGPVYVSDRPGVHDFELLKRVVLPDGSVLLAAQPGRPTADCLFTDVMRDGRSLLKACSAASPEPFNPPAPIRQPISTCFQMEK